MSLGYLAHNFSYNAKSSMVKRKLYVLEKVQYVKNA